jgi:alpha-beta hydrolase superfamily lysophospholipase
MPREQTPKTWSELAFLDKPEILQFVFYPRRDFLPTLPLANVMSSLLTMRDGASISFCFYFGSKKHPNILLFHGNGELASDYIDIGAIFNDLGLNLFVADYRGYGRSDGSPTLTNMIADAHDVFSGFKKVLQSNGFVGKLFIMGRSLGSASAIELAYHYQNEFSGMIIESGFVNIFNLLAYLGFPLKPMGITVPREPSGVQMVRQVRLPALVIHGEHDRIVPLEEGKSLYRNIGTDDKQMVVIPGVDHNTIFSGGMEQYLGALKTFVSAHG